MKAQPREQPGFDRHRRPGGRTVKSGEGPDAIEDSFDIDDYTRWRLLEGLDDIGITLSHDDDIAAFEKTRPSWKPTTIHSFHGALALLSPATRLFPIEQYGIATKNRT